MLNNRYSGSGTFEHAALLYTRVTKSLNPALTDHSQVVAEAARLTLPEVHSASVRGRVVPLDIVDHQNRRAREGRAEERARPENTRVRRVLRLRHRLLSRVDPATRRDPFGDS